MKKAILLILALAMLCTAVCACTDGGNVNDNHGGVVTDTPHDSDIGDDIKDAADDVGDAVKDGADDVGDAVKDSAKNTARPDTSPAQPQATAIPGTQVITP
ncbi:putative lipoprotein [Firmicutes bacterium CAG:555]|mgnify:FL=1|nr:putative lipoprotein [Firmicutes bacterium CAG:555]